MDAALFQAIYLLTGNPTMSNGPKTPNLHTLYPRAMPYRETITKRELTDSELQMFSDYILTLNATPIHGYEAGKLLLKHFGFARQMVDCVNPDGTHSTLPMFVITLEWDIAKAIGGIPPELIYAAKEHYNLPKRGK